MRLGWVLRATLVLGVILVLTSTTSADDVKFKDKLKSMWRKCLQFAAFGLYRLCHCIWHWTQMLSLWWNCHHWLHWKLSKWQLPVQPAMTISSKWYFRSSGCIIGACRSDGSNRITYLRYWGSLCCPHCFVATLHRKLLISGNDKIIVGFMDVHMMVADGLTPDWRLPQGRSYIRWFGDLCVWD